MKRGNTALKRGVGLASAFALAVAGAVIAAPAANAWSTDENSTGGAVLTTDENPNLGPALRDIVRPTPVGDANWVDATTGGLLTVAGAATTYTTGLNGLAPLVNAGDEEAAASGLQVRLPIQTDGTTQYATWRPGDQFVVDLPQAVTFADTPTVSVSDLSLLFDNGSALPNNDLTNFAGVGADYYDGAPTTSSHKLLPLVNKQKVGADDAPIVKPVFTAALANGGKQLVLTATTNQWGYAQSNANFNAKSVTLAAAPDFVWKDSAGVDQTPYAGDTSTGVANIPEVGFLLTLSGVKLNIGESSQLAGAGAVTATVSGYNTNGLFGQAGYNVSAAQYTTKSGGSVQCTIANTPYSYVGGRTTIAWINPITVTSAEEMLTTGSGLQSLPEVTLTEVGPNSIANGPFTLTGQEVRPDGTVVGAVDFDIPAHVPAMSEIDAAGSGDVTVKNFTPSESTYTGNDTAAIHFDVSGTNTGKIESFTLKNLRIKSSVGVNNTIKLTIAPTLAGFPVYNNQSFVNCNSGAVSAFAFGFARTSSQYQTSTDVTTVPSSDRYAGNNRYDTARIVAANLGTTNLYAVVANGENAKQGVDALAASYLAGLHDAPILLTQANKLPAETAQGLRYAMSGSASALNRTVYVIGGVDSVSNDVVNEIKNVFASDRFNVHVVRIAGSNRYATSAKVATYESSFATNVGKTTFTWGTPSLRTAFLASGTSNADALAAGSVAAGNRFPVLLTQQGSLDPSVADAIRTMGIQQVVVLGGTDRVSDEVVASLADLGVTSTKRIAGANRYETSALLYTWAYLGAGSPTKKDAGLGWAGSTALISNGVTGWPDALTASTWAGLSAPGAGWPILTTGQGTLDPAVATFIKDHKLALNTVRGLGKDATVAQSVLDQANGLLR